MRPENIIYATNKAKLHPQPPEHSGGIYVSYYVLFNN